MDSTFSVATMILRGYNYEQVRLVVEVLKGSKIKNVEVTLNTENAIEIIKKISDEYSSVMNIGAGTVLSYEELVQAVEAGAKFVLAPNMMSAKMIDYCKSKGIISVPGAFTASEISECFKMGADIVKIFPANELSYNYAQKVCEPLGDFPLMAVGGVNAENVKDVLSGSYKYVGTAGGIFKKEDIISMNEAKMRESLQRFEAALL